MTYSLFIVLLVLALDRFVPDRGGLDPFSWLGDWIDSVEQRFNGGEARHGAAALALIVGSTFLVLLLIQTLLSAMNIFLRFGLDLLVMYFLIQVHRNLCAALDMSEAVEADDQSRADEAMTNLQADLEEQAGDENLASIGSARVLSGASQWFFTPIFWFLLLGPAGAVLVYMARVTTQAWDWKNSRFQEFGKAAQTLYQSLTWVPVRCLAVSYALLGNFESALASWNQQRDTWSGSSDQLLAMIGLGALEYDAEIGNSDASLIRRAVALEYRVVAFWAATGVAAIFISFIF